MIVSTGTRRVWPMRNVGPLTDAYSLTSDWDNQWLTGGLEPDVIAEAHLGRGVDLRRDPAFRGRPGATHGSSARLGERLKPVNYTDPT